MFPAIELHMGVNTGEALLGATKLGAQRWTFTATRGTTNVAARLAGSAQGGDIVVGPQTAERIQTSFVLESLGERTLKNVSQPLAIGHAAGVYTPDRLSAAPGINRGRKRPGGTRGTGASISAERAEAAHLDWPIFAG